MIFYLRDTEHLSHNQDDSRTEQIIQVSDVETLILKLYHEPYKYAFITESDRKSLDLPHNYFRELTDAISKYALRVPLYNPRKNRIYLVYATNLYDRIKNDGYRPVTDELMFSVATSLIERDRTFINHYNLDQLSKTFLRLFYSSFFKTDGLTNCRKPSFYSLIDHIQPYYSANELYYLAADWDLLDSTEELCDKVAARDIPAKILAEHQQYIYENRAIGLVKYYSLFGSWFINGYLRSFSVEGVEGTVYRDETLENQINIFAKLVRNAPSFEKDVIAYRFVKDDDHLLHLVPGDIYYDNGFTSVTRNPFYYQENYSFGKIMIRIKLPKKIVGIALCIESYSNFPREEELILAPMSKWILKRVVTKKDKKDMLLTLNVEKKYEFVWVSSDWNDTIYLSNKKESQSGPSKPSKHVSNATNTNDMSQTLRRQPTSLKNANDMILGKKTNRNVSQRLASFIKQYANENNEFLVNDVVMKIESYNSKSVYGKFFFYKKQNGIMITSVNPTYGNIALLAEIDQEIRINYYFKYNVSQETIDLDSVSWIAWFSRFAYYLGIREVYVYGRYELPTLYEKSALALPMLTVYDTDPNKAGNSKMNNTSLGVTSNAISKDLGTSFAMTDTSLDHLKTRYTFSADIYNYLKHNRRAYELDKYITSLFDFVQLDYLRTYPVFDLIKPDDRTDELYEISRNNRIKTLAQLYCLLVEEHPRYLSLFLQTVRQVYPARTARIDNPFENICYKLDCYRYLFDRKEIDLPVSQDSTSKKVSFSKVVKQYRVRQFKNRLREFVGSINSI